jgi:hypothetical protein
MSCLEKENKGSILYILFGLSYLAVVKIQLSKILKGEEMPQTMYAHVNK